MVHKDKINFSAIFICIIATSIIVVNLIIKQSPYNIWIDASFSVAVIWILGILATRNRELSKIKQDYKQKSEILSDFVTYTSDWVYYKNLKSEVTGCNDIFCNFFGLDKKDILGKTLFEFFSPEDVEKVIKYENLVITTKQTISYEIEFNNKNGKNIFLHVVKSPLWDKNDNICGTSAICRDITELKIMANSKELYIETLTHDFKNPIIAQYQALEYLKSKQIGELNQAQLNLVNQIISSCKFTEEMLNSTLATYKHSLLRYQIKTENFNISQYLDSYLDEIQPIINGKNLKIKRYYDANITLCCDKKLIIRVIKNLLFNAIAHSAENVDLVINIKHDKTNFEFSVINNCIKGKYNQETLERMFNRFSIIKDTYRQVGAGIGLYLAKEIIKVLNGKMIYKQLKTNNEKCDEFSVGFTILKNNQYIEGNEFSFI